MQIEIRQMNLSDLNLIANNLTNDFDDFWSLSIFESELKNPNSIYFVAKQLNNQIVGFAGIWFGFEEVHITNIVTKKNKRNLGIASSLLQHLINYSTSKNNVNSITLEVNENNMPAICLYEKFNFKKVGIRKNYYNQTANAIIMTKILKN